MYLCKPDSKWVSGTLITVRGLGLGHNFSTITFPLPYNLNCLFPVLRMLINCYCMNMWSLPKEANTWNGSLCTSQFPLRDKFCEIPAWKLRSQKFRENAFRLSCLCYWRSSWKLLNIRKCSFCMTEIHKCVIRNRKQPNCKQQSPAPNTFSAENHNLFL